MNEKHVIPKDLVLKLLMEGAKKSGDLIRLNELVEADEYSDIFVAAHYEGDLEWFFEEASGNIVLDGETYTLNYEEYGTSGFSDDRKEFHVISIKKEGMSEPEYFRYSGYYSSWSSTEFDPDPDRVKKTEVTSIEWERI